MKIFQKILCVTICGSFMLPITKMTALQAEAETLVACKSAYVCDYDSGIVSYEHNAEERLPIASMCKIMTLLLSFEAVEKGEITYEEQVSISEKASGMGGSQVFLQTGLSYSVNELLKSIAVCSANDSCVAIAERIAGDENSFIQRMNERAKQLGAENTLFANCTGLPKEPQYSCAKDVAVMLRALLKYEKYYEYAKVWLEDFSHPDGRTTRITNTNRLVKFYQGCDGGKTGFTSQAGFCLAATAKRGDMRVISVVIGAESSQKRFESVSNTLNYTFSNYETKSVVKAGEPISESLPVSGSKSRVIPLTTERNISIFQKKGVNTDYSVEYKYHTEKAPIKKGDAVGEVILYKEGVECDRCALIAMDNAEKFSWSDAYGESARLWG